MVRDVAGLKGTTLACREGDCGACTVLVGQVESGTVRYRTATSCISPWRNAAGAHVVTIEGLIDRESHPLLQLFDEEGASQCGYCTPGFLVALIAGAVDDPPDEETFLSAMDGNICRCTGYHSILRAARRFYREYVAPDPSIPGLIRAGVLPAWFEAAGENLAAIAGAPAPESDRTLPLVAGGTDLLVQRPLAMAAGPVRRPPIHEGIHAGADGGWIIAASTSIETLRRDPALQKRFPGWSDYLRLFASPPIRWQGTVAGNLVNASPIGDVTAMLLALGAELAIAGPDGTRTRPLATFYRGYKDIDLAEGEHLTEIRLPVPTEGARFHFEKVSKRQYLDIASVTSAALIQIDDSGAISEARISMGGVAPTPLLVTATSAALRGHKPTVATARAAATALDGEISPISDVRGAAGYKRRLARHLLWAHLAHLFPGAAPWEELLHA